MRFNGTGSPFSATVHVPGDKSLSHRALVLAAMAPETSRIANLGPGRDVAATAAALRRLGATGTGSGLEGWKPSHSPVDCGNSGTTMRLLAGAVSGRPFETVLIGDASLMRRPMERLVGPLGTLGADVHTAEGGTPPLRVRGGSLVGATLRIDLASAQVRSAIALAALQASGPSRIDSPPGFRDHTERWLEHLGLGRRVDDTDFEVLPGPVPRIEATLPGDTSSAAFLWTATAITPGAEVRTPTVSLNPGRTGFLAVLEEMGARVEYRETGAVLGDPIGDVVVAQAPLRGVRLAGSAVASCIDEVPLVGVLGAVAEGDTVVEDAGELRVKESDRIAATVAMLRALGGEAEESANGFRVQGGRLTGGIVEAAGDHRIAMAAAVAASAAGIVEVEGFEAADVSWPGFAAALEGLWSSR